MTHETYIAGVKFRPAETRHAFEEIERPAELELIREPDNPHDPNAIRVKHGVHFLGFVPADDARSIAPRMDAGEEVVCTLQGGKRINIDWKERTSG